MSTPHHTFRYDSPKGRNCWIHELHVQLNGHVMVVSRQVVNRQRMPSSSIVLATMEAAFTHVATFMKRHPTYVAAADRPNPLQLLADIRIREAVAKTSVPQPIRLKDAPRFAGGAVMNPVFL